MNKMIFQTGFNKRSSDNKFKGLNVDTKHVGPSQRGMASGPSSTSSIPSLAKTGSTLSSSTASERDLPFTPHQPILDFDDRKELAKQFVSRLGMHWDKMTAEEKVRAQKIQSQDFTWSPTRGDAESMERFTTTFKVEWETFLARLC
jgi:hypothetical protein